MLTMTEHDVKKAVEHALKRAEEALHIRIIEAGDIVLAGGVNHFGTDYEVHTYEESYIVYPKSCSCSDYSRAAPVCIHRLAVRIYEIVQHFLEQGSDKKIPDSAVVTIRDKKFIKYEGLLSLAHKAGLESIKVKSLDVREEFALFEATATFVGGRVFTEIGDATPHNVNHNLKGSFIRVAATRAKARALRDALGIGMCSTEELHLED